MGRVIAYLATWTTYGSWLQGDKRGYVKNGIILNEDKLLREKCKKLMKSDKTTLTEKQQQIAKDAIIEKAKSIGQKLYAIAVCSNHIHLIVENTKKPIGLVISQYKNAARIALIKAGFNSRLWTKGFDKRYCFDEAELKNKIEYVQKHNKQNS